MPRARKSQSFSAQRPPEVELVPVADSPEDLTQFTVETRAPGCWRVLVQYAEFTVCLPVG
jgi:hypothetical protein